MLHKHESHLFHMCSTAHLNASRIRLNTPCIHATHHGMHVGHVEHLFFRHFQVKDQPDGILGCKHPFHDLPVIASTTPPTTHSSLEAFP